MMGAAPGNTRSRWYHEPMMWLVVGIPAVLVAASLVLVSISVLDVSDKALPVDVRRTAQIQQEDLRADRAAIDLGLRGTLAIDARTGAVEVRLAPLPDSTATLALTLPAAWTVQVAAADGAWRVAGRFERGRIEVPLAPKLSVGR